MDDIEFAEENASLRPLIPVIATESRAERPTKTQNLFRRCRAFENADEYAGALETGGEGRNRTQKLRPSNRNALCCKHLYILILLGISSIFSQHFYCSPVARPLPPHCSLGEDLGETLQRPVCGCLWGWNCCARAPILSVRYSRISLTSRTDAPISPEWVATRRLRLAVWLKFCTGRLTSPRGLQRRISSS
jgi:hypothetical protein